MDITRKFILIQLRDVLLLIVAGVAMTASGLSCRNCMNTTKDFWVVSTFTAVIWLLLWKGNEFVADFLSWKISWLKYPGWRFVVGVISTLGYSYCAILFSLWLFKTIPYTTEYNFGRAGMTSLTSVLITAVISLFMHSRSFLKYWRLTAIDAERLKKENITAKYDSLRNQVNPHFLFNSFNALSNLVYEDQDKAVKFIKQLSEVYRYVLDTREKELVTLEEEKKFMESYLFLQQIRFGNKLNTEIDLDNTRTLVAPLVLQMLVENAIKHNIVSEENPLTIRLFEKDGFIVVENNLQRKMVMQEESAGVGLENICRRYEFLSDKKVEITNGPDTFKIKLPIISELA